MAETSPRGSGNTAIVAIVVIVLIAIVAFFVFYNGGVATEEGGDVNIEVGPDGGGGGTGGGAEGD